MVISRHPDGRVALFAKEHGLAPMCRAPDGTWAPAQLVGQDLDEFVLVRDPREQQRILAEAMSAAHAPAQAAVAGRKP